MLVGVSLSLMGSRAVSLGVSLSLCCGAVFVGVVKSSVLWGLCLWMCR